MNKLTARRRVGTGKGAGRRIRDNGMIPAVLYGIGGDTVNLALNPKEVRDILLSPKGQNTTFSLEVDGGETVPCALVQTYQKDPVKRTLVHCDLIRIDPKKTRLFRVPFNLVGTSNAEKQGGRIIFTTRDSWVECTPQNIPDSIEIDISELEIGDRIRIADVETSDDITLVYDKNPPIVSASTALIIEEDLEDEEGEGEEGEEGEAGADAAADSDGGDSGKSE